MFVSRHIARLRAWKALSITYTGRRGYPTKTPSLNDFVDEFKEVYNLPKFTRFTFPTNVSEDQWRDGNVRVHAVGYLKKVDTLSKNLVFALMTGPDGSGNTIQLISQDKNICKQLREMHIHSPISIVGNFQLKNPQMKAVKEPETLDLNRLSSSIAIPINQLEIKVSDLKCLNSFPKSLHILKNQVFPPELRHMQIKYDHQLKDRLRFRSDVAKAIRDILHDFHEIETPILFKSTPEGANEFLVPSRKYGHAYALPQSPQQYKQILIASGIEKYYQFARCFRDEDLRADRQPEFTQVDLEVAFADGDEIMNLVESLIKQIYLKFSGKVPKLHVKDKSDQVAAFPIIPYDEAMSRFGSDKPDLRISGLITRINEATNENICSMLTSITDPIVEVSKLRLKSSPSRIHGFVCKFMESPDSEPFRLNPDGAPGFAIYDSSKPMSGMQIFGFEGAADIERIYSKQTKPSYQSDEVHAKEKEFSQGDLFLIQTRQNQPHRGGSTMLGKLRIEIHKAALREGLIEPDPTHHYVWVTDFPLFTINNDDTCGNGGSSHFSSTHHPFTAPKTAHDVELMIGDTLKAKADHYDLVVNGVEIGGGSRRIHVAEMQKYVMKYILKMGDDRIKDFSHLLDALAAGCPPHAGMALGFDRFIAVLTSQDSIKDVIAFPKSSKGDDLLVKSPSQVTNRELERYHLTLGSNPKTSIVNG